MPLRIGILGAGPWAREELGPAIGEHSGVRLSGVWSRSFAHAQATAEILGEPAFESVDELIDASDAVVLAVAPSAQPALALRVAHAGRAVWCEKPLAMTAFEAQQFGADIGVLRTPSFFHLPYRESAEVQALAEWAGAAPIEHVNVRFLSGALLRAGSGSEGWRSAGDRAEGVLLDLGPHGLGLAEQIGGPIRTVSAHAAAGGWHLYCEHENCTSTTALMARVAIEPSITDVEAMADDRRGTGRGYLHANARSESRRERTLRALTGFAEIARNRVIVHPFTIAAGVHLQLVLDAAQRSAKIGCTVEVFDTSSQGDQ